MPTSSSSMRDRWLSLCSRLGTSGDASTLWSILVALYAHPPRPYHSLAHIQSCLDTFDTCKGTAKTGDAVEFAIFLHDCMYDPRASDNEARSADVAAVMLRELGTSIHAISRVSALVLATTHKAPPTDPDQMLLCDIDLSIIGSDATAYKTYADNIRTEYSFADDLAYAKGRSAFLESMLSRSIIFHTTAFQARFDAQSRINMRQELADHAAHVSRSIPR